jgi:hypothetical protein
MGQKHAEFLRVSRETTPAELGFSLLGFLVLCIDEYQAQNIVNAIHQ